MTSLKQHFASLLGKTKLANMEIQIVVDNATRPSTSQTVDRQRRRSTRMTRVSSGTCYFMQPQKLCRWGDGSSLQRRAHSSPDLTMSLNNLSTRAFIMEAQQQEQEESRQNCRWISSPALTTQKKTSTSRSRPALSTSNTSSTRTTGTPEDSAKNTISRPTLLGQRRMELLGRRSTSTSSMGSTGGFSHPPRRKPFVVERQSRKTSSNLQDQASTILSTRKKNPNEQDDLELLNRVIDICDEIPYSLSPEETSRRNQKGPGAAVASTPPTRRAVQQDKRENLPLPRLNGVKPINPANLAPSLFNNSAKKHEASSRKNPFLNML